MNVQQSDNMLEKMGYQQQLDRRLTLKDLVVYGLVFMTPIAPFGIYASVVTPATGMDPLDYLIGVVGMCFPALSYGHM